MVSRSAAVATARKACASMARVVQRCQEVQRRTWCWSSPTRPLAAWNDSSMRQRWPATATRVCKRHRARAVAAQVGELAGGVVAADQQMVHAGVGVVFGQQTKPRPRVQARPVGSSAGGVALPGVGRDQCRHLVDTDRAGMSGHAPVGRDRHHIAQTVTTNGFPQARVSAIDFITGHPCGGHTGGHGPVDQPGGQCRFGRKTPLPVGDSRISAAITVISPGPWQIQGTIDQGVPAWGRVRQVHRDLGVLDPARRCRNTAVAPRRLWVPFFTSPVSSTTRIASGSPKASRT